MSQLAFLEDFATAKESTATSLDLPETAPVQNLDAGYDRGYEAGWADAASSDRSEQDKCLRDMSIALQESGFTYYEARQHVLKSLRPVLDAISERILPEAAQLSLGPKIIEALQTLADGIEDPIEILCPPAAENTLKSICEEQITFPVTISPEPTLAEQQVLFRYADGTSELNMTSCLTEIQTAISEFFEGLEQEELKHA